MTTVWIEGLGNQGSGLRCNRLASTAPALPSASLPCPFCCPFNQHQCGITFNLTHATAWQSLQQRLGAGRRHTRARLAGAHQ